MAHTFKISDFGLTLIKAYEGFRSVETTLVSGQRVIGYGHRFKDSEEPAISRAQAENLLKDDLAAYEDMVNENARAPLSQSQFDALVSLSFNIGPKAFLSSDVLHALNNGRPLEAAGGFDQWRKSVIDGKTYVVDALVRRRTAEKALFLRASEGVVSAPRLELPPKRDTSVEAIDDEISVFDKADAENLVEQAPYAAKTEHKDEGEAAIDSTALFPDSEAEPAPVKLSPIALAAEEVSERLDRLMDDDQNGEAHISVSPQAPPKPDLEIVTVDEITDTAATLEAANEGTRDDYRRPAKRKNSQTRSPDAFIQSTKIESAIDVKPASFAAYWLSMIVGASLLGAGAVKWFLKPSTDQLGQFIAPLATIVGAMIVLGSLYYLAKTFARNGDTDPS